ncbi:hypothetical protein OS493_028943 [Desmophyllum pertusum]|uniref:CCHC-type domain-containing protein n=1 Tax=Desmophyllum pertusum TaxID=174260 RepID=A0A9W9ZBD6_9CNID|nr:hypothetical protein OS493_028943 [Desmophyllum pertusum]
MAAAPVEPDPVALAALQADQLPQPHAPAAANQVPVEQSQHAAGQDHEKELAALKQIYETGSVDSALALLHQHLARPAGIFDAHAALAALEHLVDVARDKTDQRAPCFSVVLRQTRPLLLNSSFQQLLLKLVGDKEEVSVAKEIQKILKSTPSDLSSSSPRDHPAPYPKRSPPVCFNCGMRGHIASRCFEPARRGSAGRKRF